MKEGFRPKYKKLLDAWAELVNEGKTPLYDADIYERAYPNQSREQAIKKAYKLMRELRDLMEFADYVKLYQGTPADFCRRFQENAKATKPFVKPNGTVEYIPDNSARNTANADYADYLERMNAPTTDGNAGKVPQIAINVGDRKIELCPALTEGSDNDD